ncbi:MAG: GTPase ObgE [Candidatus Omnitrophica bacterium]|nr:GTPase ObgE [Candidatus Omnitrophota bacterium]
MFIDNAKINVKGGNGGKGCRCFYRDMYTRQGIADGGDGGRGADVIIRADRNLRTLLDFHYNRHFRGQDGGHGSGKKKKGKDALPLYIRVPAGTVITDAATGSVLRDLGSDADEVIVARGGRGGRGNQHHCEVTPFEPGEERQLILDLKLIADCGLVGFPNAGKSTLISNISRARPEIAAYPFTTKAPVLGVVGAGNSVFVIADIPGLIEGSSSGRGLGDRFLRHVERTRVLVHIIDMAGVDGRDPLEDYRIINKELKDYNPELAGKLQIIAANKMDLEPAKANLARFKKVIKKRVYPVSALNKKGLEELIEAIRKKL